VRGWFPDREFFMRSEGQVRFITISSRLQMSAAGVVLAVASGWVASLGIMAWNQYEAEATLASFEKEKARIETTDERLKAYGEDMDRVVEDLRARQDLNDAVLEMLPEEIREAGINVTDSSRETAETVEKISEVFPEALPLAEIEARQIAFVESVTRYADWRSRKAEEAMRKLNLDPKIMARNAERSATGGPFVPLDGELGELDPRFERMGMSLARMATLERALEAIPQVIPHANPSITSNFGYRRDPFNGRAARHPGIDFRGPLGSPIFAAAPGKVVYAGWRGGYGRLVEVRHDNGLVTRYAHLRRIDTKVGDHVEAGETIGGLGSSGRSTGPHLHFEVRLNGRAVNPRPFLETAPDVLKEARGASPVGSIAKTNR
jgi:murein DD-endopeptidase MepM/ murein hydrolase activator NlpD